MCCLVSFCVIVEWLKHGGNARAGRGQRATISLLRRPEHWESKFGDGHGDDHAILPPSLHHPPSGRCFIDGFSKPLAAQTLSQSSEWLRGQHTMSQRCSCCESWTSEVSNAQLLS
jgi:hypothetical protein